MPSTISVRTDRSGSSRLAEFTVNPNRLDPYENSRFRMKWHGRSVAGVSKVSPLKRSTEVVEHRMGGDPSATRSRRA